MKQTRDELIAETRQIISDLHFTTFHVGSVFIAPEVRETVLDDEVREAIIENWSTVKWDGEQQVMVTDHFYPVPYRVRTWVPEMFTEVFAIGL